MGRANVTSMRWSAVAVSPGLLSLGLGAALCASCVIDLGGLVGGATGAGASTTVGPSTTGGQGGLGGAAPGGAGGAGGSGGTGGTGGGGPSVTVTTIDTMCADGRLVDAKNWRQEDEVVLQLHCSATPSDCSAGTTLAGLGLGPSCPGISFAQHAGCPAALSAATGEYWFFSAHTDGIEGYEDFPDLAAVPLTFPGKRLIAMTGGDIGNLTYVLGPDSGGGPTEIWQAGQGAPLAGWDAYEIVDLDGYFIVGELVATGDPVLVMATVPPPPSVTPDQQWSLGNCEVPVGVEHHQSWFLSGNRWLFADRVVAICDGAATGRVYATEPLQGEPNLRTLTLPTGIHPSKLATSLSGDEVWIWDDAGTLLHVDVVNMTLLAQYTLGGSYVGAALERMATTEELVIGGPALGQLTLVQPEASPSRCAGGAQRVVVAD